MLRGEEIRFWFALCMHVVVTICMHTWGECAAVRHHGAACRHKQSIGVSSHGDVRNVSAGHALASAGLGATFCI